MEEILPLLILFVAGLAAGFINVNAGGGSTLTLPALIFLGLEGATANGTNRIAIAIQNISAIQSFKNEEYSQFKLSWKLSLFTLPGAIIGSLIAVRISSELFEILLGIIMIGIIISMIIPRKKKNFEGDGSENLSWRVYLSMFGIGFYGGFIQVGVGFIIMSALHQIMKMNLVFVNMHKVFIVLIYTIPAILIFIFSGNVNWFFGLTLAFGNALGAWWGAKLSVKKGEKFIKFVLVGAILIMSMKLLGVF